MRGPAHGEPIEVKPISGVTYQTWTPSMCTLEQLFGDAEPQSTAESFDDTNCPRAVVRSFSYLTGGYEGGTWNWGGNSRTTAVLLLPEAWDYFIERAAAASP